ncbi:Hos3 histone deacetylase [Candida orthopsilosis Co 90-125]|uniref:Hos3 histone deacetylase n=1 Tax=Candida orthopsilosis (strain 90-125) TaxID=1136231 RepID=H8X7H3_CANO9|nr:Hos3 histone deacetylase [Candida orthopsilosis Co 90-125]CCG23757.1 Hos3 histone deacetylase [Candida orthopsilosis Co 90-125]
MTTRDNISHHHRNDSEDSLIEAFETTLTIKPSTTEYEDNDISIDHTVLPNSTVNYTRDATSMVDIEELEENEQLEEQIPKFKTNRRYSLLPTKTTFKKIGSPGLEEYYVQQKLDPKFHDILKPSVLIDEKLIKYHHTFSDFIASNPHINKESPRFQHNSEKTLVILSPYSPEHAFGRKWVTKSYLSTIFERPQRLLASCIGVASAITMYPFYYKLINSTKRSSIFASHVRKIHGKNWPKKLFELCLESHEKLNNDEIEVPEDWNTGDIYLTPKTINAIEGVIGTIETAVDSLFNTSSTSPQAGISTSGRGNHDLAFVVIRPPGHHSHACLPSGFCLLNNVQIGIEYAFETYGVTHCAILDIDLHHGDGSQDICWERAGFTGDYGQQAEDEIDDPSLNPRNEYGKRFATFPKVGYFSLHDIKSYPTELGFATKENIKNASTCIMDHDLNIWNVHLQNWNTEDEFYKHYQTRYVAILNRANQFLNNAKKQHDQEYEEYLAQLSKYNKYLQKPHLYPNQKPEKPTPPPAYKPLIIISAGFDASEYEDPQMQRHGINVPTSFYATFTKDVVKLAKIHTKGKVISFLEGGYSDGALTTGIFSHLIGLNNDDDLLWNHTWGSEQVAKELIKGCKKNWTPYKNPKSEITIWANEVIKLGRSMMPNAILPANHIYRDQSKDKDVVNGKPVNRMVKDLLDGGVGIIETPKMKKIDDREDFKKPVRHTRSYYKTV